VVRIDVDPFQLVELSTTPAEVGTVAVFTREEDDHRIELPLISLDPVETAVPPCLDVRGTTYACTYRLSLKAPSGAEEALDLRLAVRGVPLLASSGEPGALLLSFLDGLARGLPAALAPAIEFDPTVAQELEETLAQVSVMRQAVHELRTGRVRRVTIATSMTGAPIELDIPMLRESERWLVAMIRGTLRATALSTSTSTGGGGSRVFEGREIGLASRGLRAADNDDVTQALDDLPNTLANATLTDSKRLFRGVGIGLFVMGALVTGPAATAVATLGAVTFMVATVAPAAIATVLNVGGRILKGDPVVPADLKPAFQHLVSQYVGLGLGTLAKNIAGSATSNARVGQTVWGAIDKIGGFVSGLAGKIASKGANCALDPNGCAGPGNGGTSPGTTDPNDPDIPPPPMCGVQQVQGGDAAETRTIDLGQRSGMVSFSYQTYTQEDRMTVTYEGQVLFDTGCVGASSSAQLAYSGSSSLITVAVTPNCGGGTGTSWTFTMGCP
jgi:hypothetical protein